MAEPLSPTELMAWILALAGAAFAAWSWGRVRALEAELSALKLRLEVNAEAARRALEERDASLGRVRRQADEDRRYAQEPLVRDLIPALDDFERALESSPEREDPLIAGVRMVRAQVLRALERHGVQQVSPEGDFDPHLHEAVDAQPSREHSPGAILRTWARGYVLHERVLRPARVVVASPPADPAPEEPPVDAG